MSRGVTKVSDDKTLEVIFNHLRQEETYKEIVFEGDPLSTDVDVDNETSFEELTGFSKEDMLTAEELDANLPTGEQIDAAYDVYEANHEVIDKELAEENNDETFDKENSVAVENDETGIKKERIILNEDGTPWFAVEAEPYSTEPSPVADTIEKDFRSNSEAMGAVSAYRENPVVEDEFTVLNDSDTREAVEEALKSTERLPRREVDEDVVEDPLSTVDNDEPAWDDSEEETLSEEKSDEDEVGVDDGTDEDILELDLGDSVIEEEVPVHLNENDQPATEAIPLVETTELDESAFELDYSGIEKETDKN